MTDEPQAVVGIKLRTVYDKDYRSDVVTGVRTIFVNNKYLTFEAFVDEPPDDVETLEQNPHRIQQGEHPIVNRRVLYRFSVDKDTALMLSERIKQMHRIMSGPFEQPASEEQ